MNQQTYEHKLRELKASNAPDAPARVTYLEQFYKTQQAEEEEKKTKARNRAEASFKQSLKTAYMKQANASEADFERDYPVLRTAHMQQKARETDAAARAAQRAIYRDF